MSRFHNWDMLFLLDNLNRIGKGRKEMHPHEFPLFTVARI